MRCCSIVVVVVMTSSLAACSGAKPGKQLDAGMPVAKPKPPVVHVPELRPACADDRIRKVYAIPANVVVPSSTTIEVETFDAAVAGEASVSFVLERSVSAPAMAFLTPAESCAPDSAACQVVTCTGLGTSSGPGHATLRVGVVLDDDDCRQTERIELECEQLGPAQTCNACYDLLEPGAADAATPASTRTLFEASALDAAVVELCARACES